MLVTLTKTKRASADLDGGVTWRSAAARDVGTATFALPRSSPLWSSDYVSFDQHFLVEASHDALGTWRGIGVLGDDGTISAQSLDAIAKQRVVSRHRTFRNLPAGAIALAGFRDALAGVSPVGLVAGTFAECAPVLPNYEFSGQSYADVLTDLLAQTGQEWRLSETGRFDWGPAFGSRYPTTLMGGTDVLNVRASGRLEDRVTEVIARGREGRSVSVKDTSYRGYWSNTETLSVDTSSDVRLSLEAQAALAMRRHPAMTYQFDLIESHWTIRAGDLLKLCVPTLGLGGDSPVVRVLALTWAGGTTAAVEAVRVQGFEAGMPVHLGARWAGARTPQRGRTDAQRTIVQLQKQAATLVQQVQAVAGGWGP